MVDSLASQVLVGFWLLDGFPYVVFCELVDVGLQKPGFGLLSVDWFVSVLINWWNGVFWAGGYLAGTLLVSWLPVVHSLEPQVRSNGARRRLRPLVAVRGGGGCLGFLVGQLEVSI